MNTLMHWLFLSNLYIVVVGLFFLSLRTIKNHLQASQSIMYNMWIVFPMGLIILNLLSTMEIKIAILPQITTFSLDSISVVYHQNNSIFSWQLIFSILWSVVFLIILAKLIMKYRFLKLALNTETFQFGSKIRQTENIHSPIAFGLFPANIYIPKQFELNFTYEQQQLLLAHESVHCKRYDPLIRVVYQIMEAVFWFNPMIYLLNRYMIIDQEISCDEIVLCKNRKRRVYSQLLLFLNQKQFLNINNQSELYCSSLSMLKERIMLIKKIKSNQNIVFKKGLSQILIIGAISFLITTTATLATNINFELLKSPKPSQAEVAIPAIKIPNTLPQVNSSINIADLSKDLNEKNIETKKEPPSIAKEVTKDAKLTTPSKIEFNDVAQVTKFAKTNKANIELTKVKKKKPQITINEEEIKIVPLHRPQPSYPRMAAIARLSGSVRLDFNVLPSGLVSDVHVIEVIPQRGKNVDRLFSREAVKSVEHYKFAPIGNTTKVSQTVEFKLFDNP